MDAQAQSYMLAKRFPRRSGAVHPGNCCAEGRRRCLNARRRTGVH
jgi:hypothetical protein